MKIKGEKYEGKPCDKCGTTERYVSNKKCASCDRARSKNYRNTEKGNEVCKKLSRKASDKKLYGACADNEKTERRRAAEERELLKSLGIT